MTTTKTIGVSQGTWYAIFTWIDANSTSPEQESAWAAFVKAAFHIIEDEPKPAPASHPPCPGPEKVAEGLPDAWINAIQGISEPEAKDVPVPDPFEARLMEACEKAAESFLGDSHHEIESLARFFHSHIAPLVAELQAENDEHRSTIKNLIQGAQKRDADKRADEEAATEVRLENDRQWKSKVDYQKDLVTTLQSKLAPLMELVRLAQSARWRTDAIMRQAFYDWLSAHPELVKETSK